MSFVFFFKAEDGIRDIGVTGVQTCALPISPRQSVLHQTPPESHPALTSPLRSQSPKATAPSGPCARSGTCPNPSPPAPRLPPVHATAARRAASPGVHPTTHGPRETQSPSPVPQAAWPPAPPCPHPSSPHRPTAPSPCPAPPPAAAPPSTHLEHAAAASRPASP